MKASRFNREALGKEFPFLGEESVSPRVDSLDPGDEISIQRVNENILAHVLRQDLDEDGENNEHGYAIMNDGTVLKLTAAVSEYPSTVSGREWGADSIGVQVADRNVEHIVVYQETVGRDGGRTHRSLAIYKMASYDLTEWALRQRHTAEMLLAAEMAAANLSSATQS